MFVGDHGQRDVRHGHPPDERAATKEERFQRPARVHATHANEIGRERPDFRRGLHDEPLNFDPRQQFNPRGAIVDLDAGRQACEPLDTVLEPRPIERMQKDNQGDRDKRDQTDQTLERVQYPSRPATASLQFVARAGGAREMKQAHDSVFQPTCSLRVAVVLLGGIAKTSAIPPSRGDWIRTSDPLTPSQVR
jgi:hypothetical protein